MINFLSNNFLINKGLKFHNNFINNIINNFNNHINLSNSRAKYKKIKFLKTPIKINNIFLTKKQLSVKMPKRYSNQNL